MCSLENFHTAFLNWLGETYPSETLSLFLGKNHNANNISFKNQKHYTKKNIYDLFITMDNYEKEILVIENKIKSYPGDTQLSKYRDSLKDKNAKFILLSLAPKSDRELPEGWEYMSYSDLAKKMKNIFNDNFEYNKDYHNYHKYLIEDYFDVITDLSNRFPENPSEKYDLYEEKVADDIKDIYIKFRTSKLSNYINEHSELSSDTDFRNKQGIVNVWYKLADYDVNFLIQIQHKEYRYCIVLGNEADNELRESIAAELAKEKLWFVDCIEYYPRAKIYKSKKFCGYSPSTIYRYQTIEIICGKEKMSDVTYEEIKEKIEQDISKLKDNEQKISDIIKGFV
jgi:hypothetical protein